MGQKGWQNAIYNGATIRLARDYQQGWQGIVMTIGKGTSKNVGKGYSK